MYSVLSYGSMAADGVRMDAYSRAIAATVRPGSIVLDLGAGTGMMSLLALRAGAARVHAVEIDPAVWLARDLAKANGFGDKLIVHNGSSFDLTLDERADVVVADLRGSFPLFGQNLASLEDAKRRLLAPGGVLLPRRDRLFVALAETPAHRESLERGWAGFEREGFDVAALRSATLNDTHGDDNQPVLASHLLSEGVEWAELRYGEPFARSVTADVELTVTRGGTLHSLVLWFDATVHDDVGFSNAPGNVLVYRRLVLPLLDPVHVSHGERARVTLRTDVGGDQWAWETEIAGRPRVRQATFLGAAASPEAFLRESFASKPSRSSSGERALRALEMMDGTRTLGEITESLASSNSEVRREMVVDEVKACARRYAR